MSDMELSPEDSERIQQLRRALEEEFETKKETSHRKSALQDMEELKGDFLEALRHVTRHSQSESLRAKVAMWGYDKLLEQGKATKDSLEELLDGIPTPTTDSDS